MITITIKQQTPEALAFLEYAKTLRFLKIEETQGLTPREQKFKKMLKEGLKEMKAIRTGKMKAGKLEDLLNEL